ncbi:hypothetical protein ANN_16840 [Periplaneta americana]|uniref:Tyr recombinase domain-containing protein n=1 Tax=Periplaneta americana TaxID=6978 RepID=A0ABQ8SR79_PERAM|nr:hypothetical protein ANN_16840 [Periplaneta americana]
MSPGSSTESYPAYARIGLGENLGKNLNQYTFFKCVVILSVAVKSKKKFVRDRAYLLVFPTEPIRVSSYSLCNNECCRAKMYNTFVYLFANISNCTGLDVKKQKIANHSSRCIAVSNMTRIGIQEQELIKITGHSYASSLKPYLQINEEHHSEILNKLRNTPCTSTSQLLLRTRPI